MLNHEKSNCVEKTVSITDQAKHDPISHKMTVQTLKDSEVSSELFE